MPHNKKSTKQVLVIAIALLSCITQSPSIADDILNPQKTRLFAIGILSFSNNISWSTRNRRDTQLVSLFEKLGLPKSNIDYIGDRDGTLVNIKYRFSKFLDQTQNGDFLIHYYTGHGGVGLFETTDGDNYNHTWIAKQIASKFKGKQVLLLGDCCNSGSLQDVVKNATGAVEYACLSSSSRRESGNGNWTFSQAVLDGLRGEPYVDLDHDGNITIAEIAAHVKHDIRYYEDNHSIYRKTPNFDDKIVVAKTNSSSNKEPEPVEVLYKGEWWIAKLMERGSGQAKIRWIQLGYDAPDQDIWVNLNTIRPIIKE